MTALDPLTIAGAAAVMLGVGVPIGIAVGRRTAEPLLLCCIAGPLRGRIVELTSAVHIGRGAECDLRLPDAAASRRHAIVTRNGARVYVRDQGSCDGVWSDGRRIFDAELQPGDQFQIGENVFALQTQSLVQTRAWPAPRAHHRAAGGRADIAPIEPDALVHTGAHYTILRARQDAGEPFVLKYLHDRRESVRSRFDAYLGAASVRTAAHPALVRVRGGSASAPQPYMIEDFVEGASLRVRMADGMTNAESRDVMAQLFTVFEDLHAAGISHGALDAGDVLFARDGDIRLLGVDAAHIFDAVQNHPEDDVAALASIGEALFGSASRHTHARMHARTVIDLRRRWGIERRTVSRVKSTVEFHPLRLRMRGVGVVTTVTSNPFILGRALNPMDRSLSRQHAELIFENNMWIVRPHRGARVVRNGTPLTTDARVVVGDELKLGETVLVIAE